jgi:hypothetical protein
MKRLLSKFMTLLMVMKVDCHVFPDEWHETKINEVRLELKKVYLVCNFLTFNSLLQ